MLPELQRQLTAYTLCRSRDLSHNNNISDINLFSQICKRVGILSSIPEVFPCTKAENSENLKLS
jgi:hypothetical protein